MKKVASALLMSLVLGACTAAHPGVLKRHADQRQVAKTTNASTPVGATDQHALRAFQEHYRYRRYAPFKGTVQGRTTGQEHVYGYGPDTLHVVGVDERYGPLFTRGILFPAVYPGGYLPRITNIEELPTSQSSTQRRRFTMLVWGPVLANPTLYVFELTNPHATPQTDLPSFLQEAVLTFIRNVTILI